MGWAKIKSLVRALSSSALSAMHGIVHVTFRTAVANKTIGAKKNKRK